LAPTHAPCHPAASTKEVLVRILQPRSTRPSSAIVTAIFALVVCPLSACGTPHPSISRPQIVGGSAVRAGEAVARSTVALIGPDDEPFCSGSLIAPRVVLTAAHCLEDLFWDQIQIAFGTNARSPLPASRDPDSLRAVADAWQHEDYSADAVPVADPLRSPDDIGLVVLADPAPAGYVPVALAAADDALDPGTPVTLAGFGLRDADDAGSYGQLSKVDTAVTSVSEDVGEFTYGGTPGHTACSGDSGGPAFIHRGRSRALLLAGVTSRGDRGCAVGGIYTDVRAFRSWIAASGIPLD
jgi:secreted trypsin-like serine protease